MAELEKCVKQNEVSCVVNKVESRQIQYIYDNTHREYPGVGVLAASNRDIWAKVRLFHLLLTFTDYGKRIVQN